MKIVFPDEMRVIDKETIDLGVPSLLLMENAARSLLNVVEDMAAKTVLIVCGTGNNGGDGYALARLLHTVGIEGEILSVGKPSTDDARKNRRLFERLGGTIYDLDKMQESVLEKIVRTSDMIVDGIYGTGFHGGLSDEMTNLIKLLNSAKANRIAIDIPSGVDGEKGSINPVAFKADKTVTFGAPKVGHFLYPGRTFTGELVVAPAGFPSDIIESNSSITLIDNPLAAALLPERPADGHKGSFGRVLIIGGSRDYTGAPLLSAVGSLRTGTGLVYTFTPEHVQKIIRERLPEVIALSSGDNEENLSQRHFTHLVPLLDKIDCVVIGPGIGRAEETTELVRKVIRKTMELKKLTVVDADGLYGIEELEGLGEADNILLTPHLGEFSRLAETAIFDIKNNPARAHELCRGICRKILLKSESSFLINQDESWLNITGNTGLSKGGSGDLLAGSIAGFSAQKGSLISGAILGAYFLGKSAEISGKPEPFLNPLDIGLGYEEVFRFLGNDTL